jgi:multidrug transporter EmrE-like cation transporter
MGYVYLIATVLLTVYGQLAFKWQIDNAGAFPGETSERLEYLTDLAVNPWMVSVFLSVLAAAATWGAALTRFELSFAYPFLSLSFVLVLLLSGPLFSESVTVAKLVGVALIVAGLVIGSQSW